MAATSENKPKQYISVGILAHVDAGKTTLSEGILYLTGQIRKLGRVDHGDAFLDMYTLERSRGITIFSKQANFVLGDKQVTLLDTPGHVDFSAEMERTLQVLDYAILVVSGADGVQGHTRTLWNLLARYQVPTFIFINKMDQDGTDRQDRLTELKRKLSGECVDFTEAGEEFLEELSMCDETVMESYLENGEITASQIQTLIRERKVFPCYFGSALKLEGVQELLDGLEKYMDGPVSGTHAEEAFGAKVYKISRDSQGSRLTHVKITNGVLKVKEILEYMAEEEPMQEKVNQIRIYSGDKYEMVQEAEKFEKYLSIASEAAVAAKSGARAMHDVSGGGIYAALWEIAEGAGTGLEVDLKKIPVKQETIEIAEFFELNPYQMLSGGSLLIAVENGKEMVRCLQNAEIPAVVIGKLTEGKDRILINEEETRYLEMPQADEIHKVLG